MGTFVNYKKLKCCEYSPMGCILDTLFSLLLMDGPNKLESLFNKGF